MTKFLLSLAERLLDRLFPTKRPAPKVPPHPGPRDLLHIDRQIQSATAPGCCPFTRSGGFHGEDCYDQGREDCTPLKRGFRSLTPREDRIIDEHLGSPRAITERHAVPPAPRKRR